jgi:magnesium transporter
VSSAPPSGDGLAVPFLIDPEHEDVAQHVAQNRFFWLDLQGPSERQLQKLAQLFDLHPLTVEDARKFGERPKLEEYGSYVFMVAYGVDPGTSSGGPLLREVHLIVSGRYVVTIHRRPFRALEELRERYDAHRVRSEQFLVYKILDAVTATFFPVLSRIDDDIDELEEDMVQEPNEEILRRIFSIKRDLVAMRRVVTPQRDVFARDAERIGHLSS